jgi:hypothetical protein
MEAPNMIAPAMSRRTAPVARRRSTRLVWLALLLAAAWVGRAHAAAPTPAPEIPGAVEVKVERIKPRQEKLPTLRFLKENRDFIRSRFDQLVQTPLEQRASANEMDPRYLAYRSMLAQINAAKDSVATVADLHGREELLAMQRTRLGVLQADFAGEQRTSLMVLVEGDPAAAGLTRISIRLEDGATLTLPLTADQHESLRHGGLMQIFHGFVEPREQVVEVTLAGGAWPSGETGYVTLEPARDRLMLLRLDLTEVGPARGAAGIRAHTWLHDAGTPSREG